MVFSSRGMGLPGRSVPENADAKILLIAVEAGRGLQHRRRHGHAESLQDFHRLLGRLIPHRQGAVARPAPGPGREWDRGSQAGMPPDFRIAHPAGAWVVLFVQPVGERHPQQARRSDCRQAAARNADVHRSSGARSWNHVSGASSSSPPGGMKKSPTRWRKPGRISSPVSSSSGLQTIRARSAR